MNCLNKLATSAAVVMLFAAGAAADTLWIGDNPRVFLKSDDVKVQPPTDSQNLPYTTPAGTQASKSFSKLVRINIDGETNFNAAEDAYFNGDLDSAISKYQSMLQSSTADWMQKRAATRLILAGKAKNRYDAQVSAYVVLIRKDPTLARANKPAEPTANTPNLDTALASIQKGLDDPKLEASQKSALLDLQLKIAQVKGDTSQTQATLKQMVAMGGGDEATKATLALAEAGQALANKQYAQAVTHIEQNRTIFNEPDQQVDALFVLAEAKFALDGSKSDATTLKDLALNYMRVVTFGKQLPDQPHVAESLYQAGQIEEKLNENTIAAQLYAQVTHESAFTNSPARPKAEAALSKLQH